MRRLAFSTIGLSLLSLSMTGCCCCSSLCGGYGAGYAPAPACPPTYGAGYGVSPAPMAPACPTGNCGVYPTSAFYGPTPVAAALPGTYTTAAVPLNPVPTY